MAKLEKREPQEGGIFVLGGKTAQRIGILKDLKDSYSIKLTEYAIMHKIDKELAFAWWVPYIIKKLRSIISKLKSKYWQQTHNYGIHIQKNGRS